MGWLVWAWDQPSQWHTLGWCGKLYLWGVSRQCGVEDVGHGVLSLIV